MIDNIVQFPGKDEKQPPKVEVEAPTFVLTIEEESYEVYSVIRPRLKNVEWEVFTLKGTATVPGPAYWTPLIVEGEEGIGDAIQGGTQPIIMTLDVHQEEQLIDQWEFTKVYLSTESKGDRFVIVFENASQFKV